MLWPILFHDTAPHQGKGCCSQGKCTVLRDRAGSHLELHLSSMRLAINNTCRDSKPGVVQNGDWCQNHPSTYPSPHQAPTPKLLAQYWSPLGRRCQCQESREENQLRPKSQGFCSSSQGPNPALDGVMLATKQRRSPSSPLALDLTPPPLAPPPTKEIGTSTPCRKRSRSVVSDSLRPHGLQPTRLLCPWDFPGNSTGVDCHFLLHGIFPNQGSNPSLPHCRQTFYHLSHQGSSIQVILYSTLSLNISGIVLYIF